MIQLCAGLSFAHTQGIIHRDIKPSNVRVLESGTVKLLDFGIAKLSRSDATFSDLAGSVEYMSPEQLEGRAVNERSDVFAVGAVMYELFGGGKPFAGDTPEAIAYHILNERPAPLRSVAPDVPQPLEDIVTRALEKDPDRRHASAAELMAALRLVSETVQPTPTPSPAAGRIRPRGVGNAGEIRLAGAGAVASGSPVGDLRAHHLGEETAPAKTVPGRRRRRVVIGIAVAAVLAAATALGGPIMLRTLGGDLPAVDALTLPRSPGPDPVLALSVDTEPQGARIQFDGEDAELVDGERLEIVTPASVPFRDRFPAVITLTRAGFAPIEVEVPDAEGNTLLLVTTLAEAQAFGRVRMSGPYPFEVWQGNRRVSAAATEHDVRVRAGSTSLRLRNDELFLNQRLSLDVAENQSRDVPVGAPGSVTVFSRPGNCEILIDEQSVGFPPITGRAIAAGRHTVARECPDAGQSGSREISIESGEVEQVTFAPAP